MIKQKYDLPKDDDLNTMGSNPENLPEIQTQANETYVQVKLASSFL